MHSSPTITPIPTGPPSPGLSPAGPIASFVAPVDALSPQDRALAGLIAKGHGRDACAAFLGLTDAALMGRVVALGLPTAGDRALRLGTGAKAWSLPDIRRLVDLWCGNLPGSRIAGLLGRSAGGVYAKARWLGLFKRPRAALLRDPPPSTGFDAPEPAKPKRRGFDWTVEGEDDLAERWFALQSHRGIARDLGLSPTAVASKAHRLQLPCRAGLTLHDDYSHGRRTAAAHLFAGWTRRLCNIRKRPFWTRQAGVVFSDEARRQRTYQALSGGSALH